jgi:hypothetical protein
MGIALALAADWASTGRRALWIVAAAILVYVPRELGWWRFPPLLESTRQVPQRWARDYSTSMTALLYGLGLGSGLYTRIVAPTYYLLLAWPFVTGGFAGPVAAWCIYGLARSANLWWLAATAPVADPFTRSIRMVESLARQSGRMHRANAVIILCTGGYLAWLAART